MMISFAHLVLLVTLGTGLLSLRRWIVRGNFRRRHGCQEVPWLTEGIRFLDVDLVYLFFKRSRRGLEKLPLEKQFEVLGSTFQTQTSIKPTICTMDPLNLQAVFSTDADSFANRPLRYFAFSPLVGNGVMTLDGVAHERARALLRPTFSMAHIKNDAAYDRHVQKLINLLLTTGDGSTVDLQSLFERLDLDISTEFIFGESVASLDAADSLVVPHKFPTAFDIAQKGMGARFRMLPFNILHRDRQFWEACSTIRQFVAESIESALVRRRENNGDQAEKSYILVDNLLQESQDMAEIQDALMNVFLPGHDTIGIVLSNIFFHLARHPDIWHKLRQQVLNLPEITTDSLKRLDYLQHIIKETLRVNPPVSNMTRIAIKDTALPTGGGPDKSAPVYVPKGTVVACSFYDVHRRRDIYGGNDNNNDTEAWRPERWENLDQSELAWKFVPFGGGPHLCPGQNLALNRVAYTVARLVEVFDRIENRDPVLEYVPMYKLVIASQNGVKVALYSSSASSGLAGKK